jgi:hypothetical protein
MDRSEFERLRAFRPKTIVGDIALLRPDWLGSVHQATGVPIRNTLEPGLRLTVRWNHETERKTISVYVLGVGPICRVDADGPPHGPAGKSHKHSLITPQCPALNLRAAVAPRPDLSGLDVKVMFLQFCREVGITFEGRLLIGH